ncbi:hypothetical protein L4X63_03835 [Geomonas sp. Red32]|uniref:hypothetical protein n=1 Tax=Geomonas sp. Red32 TaxID=2912856 RepID=UPI00202D05AF|nr:hypothetical protein [Geomonas sp. Red32]MCM0080715.1 hypothetical protein [Geomonas sp. Red32]
MNVSVKMVLDAKRSLGNEAMICMNREGLCCLYQDWKAMREGIALFSLKLSDEEQTLLKKKARVVTLN